MDAVRSRPRRAAGRVPKGPADCGAGCAPDPRTAADRRPRARSRRGPPAASGERGPAAAKVARGHRGKIGMGDAVSGRAGALRPACAGVALLLVLACRASAPHSERARMLNLAAGDPVAAAIARALPGQGLVAVYWP